MLRRRRSEVWAPGPGGDAWRPRRRTGVPCRSWHGRRRGQRDLANYMWQLMLLFLYDFSGATAL